MRSPIAVRYTCTEGHFYSTESAYYINKVREFTTGPVAADEGRDVDEGREEGREEGMDEGALRSIMEDGNRDEEVGISYHANHIKTRPSSLFSFSLTLRSLFPSHSSFPEGRAAIAASNLGAPSPASSHAPAAAPPADPLDAPLADPLASPHANFLDVPPADPLASPHADPLAAPPAATTAIRVAAATAVWAISVVSPATPSRAHRTAASTVRHAAASSGNHHPIGGERRGGWQGRS
ncbi:unnamed protein product [Closterium sp. NIES-54]